MPIPTTRYARFLYYKKRFQLRRARNKLKVKKKKVGEVSRGPNERDLSGCDFQGPKRSPRVVGAVPDSPTPFQFVYLKSEGRRRPPLWKLVGLGELEDYVRRQHARFIGAIERRGKRIPHLRRLPRKRGPIVPRPPQRFEDRTA